MEKPLPKAAIFSGLICASVGALIFIIGIIMGHFNDEGFGLFLNPLTPQGVPWLVIGGVILASLAKSKRRIAHLKEEGFTYDAEVLGFTSPLFGYHGLSRHGVRFDLAYVNQQGEKCLVRSKVYMIGFSENAESMLGKVYVNPDNPAKYEVEVFRKYLDKIQYDKDYR